MAEFGVNRNEEYCNISPKYSQFIDEEWLKSKGHFYFDSDYSAEPYFQCLLENSKHTKTDARKC